jgi:hypothetical protein
MLLFGATVADFCSGSRVPVAQPAAQQVYPWQQKVDERKVNPVTQS